MEPLTPSPVAGIELEEGLFIKHIFLRGATPYLKMKMKLARPHSLSNSTTNSNPVSQIYAQNYWYLLQFKSWNLITWPRTDKIMAIKVVGSRFLNLLFILLDFRANFGQHDQIWANIVPNWPKNDRNKKSVYTSSKTQISSHKNFQQCVCLCACMWRACVCVRA